MNRKKTTVVRTRLDIRDVAAAFLLMKSKGLPIRSVAAIVSTIFEAYMDSIYRNDLGDSIPGTEQALEILQAEGILIQQGNERNRAKVILEEGEVSLPSIDEARRKAEAFLEGGDT